MFVPRRMREHLAREIPGVDFHWLEDKGHFDLESWDSLFATCRAHIAAS